MKIIIIFLICFAGAFAGAKVSGDISTEINFGEKLSSFRIFDQNGEHHFTFINSYGKQANGPLSKSGYDFLVKKVNDVLKEQSNDMNFCTRKYMSVKTVLNGKPVERKACIGSDSAIAKRMTELANTLQLLL